MILKKILFRLIILSYLNAFYACTSINIKENNNKIPVIFDTDANNELDDQHALAYLLLNDDVFDVKAITVNATYNGGNIDEHYKEAKRVVDLCNKSEIPLYKGANSVYDSINHSLSNENFDGYSAVNYIISEAKKYTKEKLVIIAVGKLTNVALAVKKDSSIINNIRLVWLGSNYPEPGEYNLENDISAMNYLLQTNIAFEMPVCRYNKPSGTDAVRVVKQEMLDHMKDVGPKTDKAVTGRHGGEFYCFGNYSISLFEHCHYYGNPPYRALFDMAAVAIVKNPNWAEANLIPAPIMMEEKWVEQPNNKRKIIVWENFNSKAIKSDFFNTFR